MTRKPAGELRRGWTTGACATAATKAAYARLLTGAFPDPVAITLPKGETPSFPLAVRQAGEGWAAAGIVKDAGDDPDVTHGATVIARVALAAPGTGVKFRAGEGVGTITKPGLPLPPGEPAINPAPREMMRDVVAELATAHGAPGDVEITISIPGGTEIARQTWNGRLGIVGGLSVLGTTGVVRPFSCSAWIASIHRGIDVARAEGLSHFGAATGATSEAAVRELYGLPESSMLDMGDFAGGMLKYLRANPLPRLTIGGGFGKMAKLAQGALDRHSGRSQVDFGQLAEMAEGLAYPARIRASNTAAETLEIAGPALGQRVAEGARKTALETLGGAPVEVEVLVIDRKGAIVGRAGF